jgi:predicted CopG family antitoxin
MYIERQQLVEELRLRKLIQQAIRIVESKKTITEDEVSDTSRAPYDNTGLNTLNTLFDNILKQIEQGYKELTTSKEQRDSFSAHILKAVENTLAPLRALDKADQTLEEDVDINIGQDTPEDMTDIRMSDEEKAKEDFTIEDQDLSGRDKAYETFNKVETQIVDAYKTLHNPDDIKSFYDGLLMNLDLYFQKFEDEMAPTVEKPEIDVAPADSAPTPDVGGDEDMDLEDIADM